MALGINYNRSSLTSHRALDASAKQPSANRAQPWQSSVNQSSVFDAAGNIGTAATSRLVGTTAASPDGQSQQNPDTEMATPQFVEAVVVHSWVRIPFPLQSWLPQKPVEDSQAQLATAETTSTDVQSPAAHQPAPRYVYSTGWFNYFASQLRQDTADTLNAAADSIWNGSRPSAGTTAEQRASASRAGYDSSKISADTD